MKVLLGIQARTASKRLPGKIYERIGEKSILEWVYTATNEAHRRLNARLVPSDVVVLGPETDETLREFCGEKKMTVFLPPAAEDDLLERYKQAVVERNCTGMVRITADCWMMEPDLIVEVVELLHRGDYVSNTIRRTFMEGYDLQACSRKALDWFDYHQRFHREHPFWELDLNASVRAKFQKDGFKILELLNPEHSYLLKGSSIDCLEDLERARQWYEQREKNRQLLDRAQ